MKFYLKTIWKRKKELKKKNKWNSYQKRNFIE